MHYTRKNSPCRRRSVSRREFLGTLGASTAAMLVGSPLRAFGSVRPQAARVAVAAASNYERARVRATMEALFDGLGGLSDIIRSGDRVGIKINLTGGIWNASNFSGRVGMPPGETYWTHPEVLRAVGELVRDAGAGSIYVLEANGEDWNDYRPFGYVDAAQGFGGTLVNLNYPQPHGSFVARSTGSHAFIYETFTQHRVLEELDCMVSLAKSKQHAEAGVTHGLKNLVGCVPVSLYNDGAGSRQALHRHTGYDGDRHSNLCRVVLDLNGASPIHLVVNDVVRTVLGGEGPWHALTPASFDTFVASKDPVAADAVATQVMGFDPAAMKGSATFPESLNYLQLAEEIGLGTANPALIEAVQVSPTGTDTSEIPGALADLSAYPNPFAERLEIALSMRRSAFVSIAVHDLAGRRVSRLASRSLPVGRTVLEWSGRSDEGRRMAAGIYLLTATVDGRRITRKVARIH